MLAILRTTAVFGVEAYPVSVEVDVSDGGLPAMTMVGLPDGCVRESCDRVQSGIRNSGSLDEIRATSSLASGRPGRIATFPFRSPYALFAMSKRSFALRWLLSGP